MFEEIYNTINLKKDEPSKFCGKESSIKMISDIIATQNVKSVLDIGCGPTSIVRDICKELKKEYTGVDFNDYEKKDIIKCDAHELSSLFKENRFDLVVCSHILEHAISPLLVLFEIKKVLTSGGTLFIECPPYTFGHTIYPWHIINLTEQQIEHLLIISRFNVIYHNNYNESRAEIFLARKI